MYCAQHEDCESARFDARPSARDAAEGQVARAREAVVNATAVSRLVRELTAERDRYERTLHRVWEMLNDASVRDGAFRRRVRTLFERPAGRDRAARTPT